MPRGESPKIAGMDVNMLVLGLLGGALALILINAGFSFAPK